MKHHLLMRVAAILIAVAGGCGIINASEWQLVADRTEKMPLYKVVCLLSTDNSDRMTVVGLEKSLYNVGRVTFEHSGSSSIEDVTSPVDTPSILPANSSITITGLTRDASLSIYTTDGRLIESNSLRVSDGPSIEISIAHLNSGLYIVKILDSSVKILKR